jgi:2-keto-4-pentenoate hydratase/2-oxohepta-3-ene-1,7-dioic acid hydratase in catechol pathway
VNSELRRNGNTNDLIFDIPTLIEFLSQGTMLKKGSLIVTGTPGEVGFAMKPPKFLREGDVEISIEKIGTLVHGISYPNKNKSDS